MLELHVPILLAVSRSGAILVLLLLTSGLLYLAIRGIRTGKVRGRFATYTEKENMVMFWVTIFAYFFLAFLILVFLLAAAFAP